MTSENPPDLSRYASLFIVKPSSLGDIVHTLPAVNLLKQAHPHLKIRWISNPEWMPLLEGNPDLTEVVPFPRKEFRGIGGAAKFFLWSRTLNAAARDLPELTLDFQGLLRSALISKARGSDTIIGLSDAREGASLLHDHVVTVNPGAHAVDRNLEIPRYLGIEPSADQELRFHLPAGTKPAHADLPDEYLLIHPTSRGEGKSLSHDILQTLCDCLAPRPVIIVGREEQPPELRGKHILSLINQTTLPELLWLIHHAKACLSVDSGPMHLAAAAGIPTLGIHTWSDPRKVGPYQSTAEVWKAGRIAHRQDFQDAEAAMHKQVESNDARRMGDFLLKRWELHPADSVTAATRSL
ncbi:glycosyltransferase family 9 protein [Phragmitibacter flavus]|uniref:Glycosyltransferase family 9 protein n=1 Tax=Phragmitibacter flavus TaxID=2576071 RepID=A0A5R8KHG4_9BACT|nr:glycosyltransferase family 9 protein [Phragmitibacter flavus]TLD71425.1 glycosyltransferase family 9 protein [Phragmitibacter flavus]